jgi:hypothetical protein
MSARRARSRYAPRPVSSGASVGGCHHHADEHRHAYPKECAEGDHQVAADKLLTECIESAAACMWWAASVMAPSIFSAVAATSVTDGPAAKPPSSRL